MASKSKSKQEEALQFLDDLDSLSPGPQATVGVKSAPMVVASAGQPANEAEAAAALAFLDEITPEKFRTNADDHVTYR